jgi:hypothetical protein
LSHNRFLNVIDTTFPLPKKWALKDNQKLGVRGSGIRIKKNVKAMLERFFLLGNQRHQDRMNAQAMHDELLKYVEAGELKETDIPKVNTIQNWISLYTRTFKQNATEKELETELQNEL